MQECQELSGSFSFREWGCTTAVRGCDRSIPKTCAVDHLCQCWRFAYLIDMRVKSNGWGANDFQPSRWEEMSYQVNVKHASRHTTKMRIPQALHFYTHLLIRSAP